MCPQGRRDERVFRLKSASRVNIVLGCIAGTLLGCVGQDVPAEPESRSVSAVRVETPRTPRVRVPPDYARARAADEAAHAYARAHTHTLPSATPPPPSTGTSAHRGIPNARFLNEPALALGPGFLVADVSFLTSGEPDDFTVERTGRFHVRTTRFRVHLNAVARRGGEALPDQEFDLFASPSFHPTSSTPGELPRMLVVIGDRSFRPGFNLKVAAGMTVRGFLREPAFGIEVGAFTDDVFRRLQTVVRGLPQTSGSTS